MSESTSIILIVDDNPTNIDLLRRYLEPENYRISAVTSGEKAIELALKLQPDLILLDIMMPGIDGYETCERLKSESTTQQIPIIFVTAKVTPEDLRKGFSAGGADYITKPVDQEVLLARVSYQLSVVKKQKLERELLEQSQYMASLGELVAEITHEVASPLGNVQLIVGALKSEINRLGKLLEDGSLQKSELSDFFVEYADAIATCEKNSVRAEQIMSSFKNIAVSQCNPKLTATNLAKLMTDVLHTAHPKLKKTSHHVSLDIPTELQITSYTGALTHIITNLINNAVIHAFDGMENGEVKIHANALNGRVTMSIHDNGKGIQPEHLSQVFDKFFTTKPTEGGSGIGLDICKKMVQEHLQGSIRVDSTFGKGTCFTLTFPQHLAD